MVKIQKRVYPLPGEPGADTAGEEVQGADHPYTAIASNIPNEAMIR